MKMSKFKRAICVALAVMTMATTAVLAGCNSQITVPDVTGKSETEASEEITALGLTMTVQRERYSDTTPEGYVDSMITKAGETAQSGDEVRVVLSLGEGRTVPNLSVLTGAEAENLLKKVDLNPIIVEEASDTVEAGYVISYTDGGQILAKGSDVTVTVSTGPAA